MAQVEQHHNRRASDVSLDRKPVRIRMLNAVAIVLAAVLSLTALTTVEHILEAEEQSEYVNEAYHSCTEAARNLQDGSDYLTTQVRMYVTTGNRSHMDAYLEEIEVTDRRGKAVETLKEYFDPDAQNVVSLEEALSFSNALAQREYYAMKLVAVATGLEDVPEVVDQVALSAEDLALSAAEQRQKAEQIVLGEEYQSSKDSIQQSVDACSASMLEQLHQSVLSSTELMNDRLVRMQVIIGLLLGIIVFVIFALIFLILWPLAAYGHRIARNRKLIPVGADELRYLAIAYNVMYDENRERTMNLKRAAERDALTGLYNRGAYDDLLLEHTQDVALLLIDVDYFKTVNDTYGHNTGDAVLKKVADLIEHSFRNTDYPCRVGGDEFAVIMTDIHPTLKHVVADKVEAVAKALSEGGDGLPPVTLSIGIAFSGREMTPAELYKAADKALYDVKERGRNGYAFYEGI